MIKMKNPFNMSVHLYRDDNSQPLPLWTVLITIVPPILMVVLFFAIKLDQLVPHWAPNIALALAAMLSVSLVLARVKTVLKPMKALLDLLWNVWSGLGVATTFAAAATFKAQSGGSEAPKLETILNGLNAPLLTMLAVGVFIIACGRAVVSTVELLTSFGKQTSQAPSECTNVGQKINTDTPNPSAGT
jgi:hypothetical protein